jgi:hypothetical protein
VIPADWKRAPDAALKLASRSGSTNLARRIAHDVATEIVAGLRTRPSHNPPPYMEPAQKAWRPWPGTADCTGTRSARTAAR